MELGGRWESGDRASEMEVSVGLGQQARLKGSAVRWSKTRAQKTKSCWVGARWSSFASTDRGWDWRGKNLL